MTIHVIGATGGLIGTFVAHTVFLIGLGRQTRYLIARWTVVATMAAILVFYIVIEIKPLHDRDWQRTSSALCEWSAAVLIIINLCLYSIELKNVTLSFECSNDNDGFNENYIQQ
jgi:hypothetical protein